LCTSSDKFIFVYVLTSVKNFEERQLIRQTWANNTNLKVGFIIGQTEELLFNKMINLEHNQYDDLIQGNFIDTFR